MDLNAIMELDHVVRVHDDGTVTDEPDVYAPELLDGEINSDEWEFFSTDYTGQHGYRGPIMHNSEYIGGWLERDILATPGVYVAVAAYWTPEDGEDREDISNEGWAVLREVTS